MEEFKGKFILTGADTDSIAFCYPDGRDIGKPDRERILKEINSMFPDKIRFEDDGYYDTVIVVKAKNYLLKQGDKITIKGSALKATMKETALKDFLEKSLKLLMENKVEDLEELYMDYVDQIKYLKDIKPWCSKKTITESVLTQSTPAQAKVYRAIEGLPVQEGDKIRVFFKSNEEICLEENFDGTFESGRLYEKLFKTVKVFEPIFEKIYGYDEKIIKKTGEVKKIPAWKKVYPNFKLKGNQILLEEL